MELKFQIISCILLMCGVYVIQAKIVYLNGTEILGDKIRNSNLSTTNSPALKWYSIFEPRNISNHAGSNFMSMTSSTNRKNDEEEIKESVTEEESDEQQNGTMATRDTTVLTSIRGLWSDLTPMLTILSTIIGIFLLFVIIESPLSPLPVPPLPYPPVGPFPPTNAYPFGVPPPRHHYGIHYVGSPSHASYRIPRQMWLTNETIGENIEKAFQNLLEKIDQRQTGIFSEARNMSPTTVLEKGFNMLMKSLRYVIF
ncbi:uncharacterized protein LOC118194952 [Stegodyphus dumicola]|uniref:uncharacterized protein LOC118194952 n=1 Tax=Stegodyphus dumicola TaxID=202533 RepID=UPI0015AAC5C1|nr:uncharacterized protein LOC118194952 [Stegodyphus dumicola]